MWKAERRLRRPLSPLELSVVTQDSTPLRRQVADLLTEVRADTVDT